MLVLDVWILVPRVAMRPVAFAAKDLNLLVAVSTNFHF
jgi:hypothetical protein